MMTKSIERAEGKQLWCRKRLLEYDDVMNEVVYKRRRHALFGERLKLDITCYMTLANL
jgi:preprotein translocase subunit SecA